MPVTVACLPSEATTANVIITMIDGAGASTTSTVTVTNGNIACSISPVAYAPLTLLPSALTATASDADRAVTISGGTGSYLADSDNLNVVSTSINGNNLILNFNKEGSTSVTVRDSAGTEAKIAVNVTSSTNALQLSPSNLSILEGTGSLNLKISGGNGTYTTYSNNPTVTVGAISGTNLPVTVVCLPSEATSANVIITMIDGTGASTTSTVTVTNGNAACNISSVTPTPLSLLPSALTATASDADRAVTISGGIGSYSAASDNINVVSTSINGSNLILDFKKEGSTSVTVRDSAGTEVKIAVNVTSSAPLSVLPSALTATAGDPNRDVTILGGTGGYTAVADNANVIGTSINSNNLTIDFKSVGAANVTVQDSAGTQTKLAIVVTPLGSAMYLSPSEISTLEGTGSLTLTLFGGNGSYTAYSDSAAVKVGTITAGTNLLPLTIDCLAAGATSDIATITVVDGTSASTTSKVTVSDGNTICGASNSTSNGLTVAPTVEVLNENTSKTLTVSGGTSPYTLYIDKVALKKISETASSFTIQAQCVTADTNVTLRVVDAIGRSTAASWTVANNAPGTCP